MSKVYWTKEKCKEVALLCKYRNEFNKKYKSAYVASSKNGWLVEICNHMQYNQTPPNSWTKERCKEVALKYNCRSDFQKSNYNVYRIAYDQKWLNEICSHMIKIGNIYKRLVYIYKFSDNSIYVGLTCNSIRRSTEHLTSKTSVYKHIKETGLYPIYTELTDYIDSVEASEMEKYYVEYYRKDGFNILNKSEAGGLGGGKIKWTYENCKIEASNYSNRSRFSECKRRAYDKCIKEGWLDDFYPKK
jgi:predicted GIY-YIG superfamily endonuclease